MEMQETLKDRIRDYAAIKAERAAAEEVAKEVKARLDAAEQDVISAMFDVAEASGLADPGALRVAVDGYNYGVTVKNMYSIAAADREEGFDALRAVGLGDIIVEKVDDRVLTKVLQEVAAEHDGILPDEYLAVPLKEFSKTTLSARKAAG